MPVSDLNEVRRDWDDLARHDLVQAWTGGMMTAAGAGDLTVRLTDHGRAFVALLTLGEPLLEPKE